MRNYRICSWIIKTKGIKKCFHQSEKSDDRTLTYFWISLHHFNLTHIINNYKIWWNNRCFNCCKSHEMVYYQSAKLQFLLWFLKNNYVINTPASMKSLTLFSREDPIISLQSLTWYSQIYQLFTIEYDFQNIQLFRLDNQLK